jgi:hypothetical protein
MNPRKAEHSDAYQLGYLQEAVKQFLAGQLDQTGLRTAYDQVVTWQREANQRTA